MSDNDELIRHLRGIVLHTGDSLVRRAADRLEHLAASNAELLAACQKLLDYHMWAKAPGQWDTEPDDPAEEVITAIKHAQEATP